MPTYSNESGDLHYPKALTYARKALALDPTIAEAHAVLAEIARMDYHWSAAEAHYRSAIESEPKNSTSHLWYTEHLLATGRIDAALEEGLIAYRLDPLSPGTNSVLGYAYWFNGDDTNAEKYTKQAVQLGHVGAIFDLSDLMLGQGRFEESLALATEFEAALEGINGIAVARVAAYQDENARQAFFDRLDHPSSQLPKTYFVSDYVSLGRMDEAFKIASDIHAFQANVLFVFWRKSMSAFRSDPRFISVIKAAGYTGYWDEYGWPPACSRTADVIVCH
jgi:Tfp pilus assembly protein PilF